MRIKIIPVLFFMLLCFSTQALHSQNSSPTANSQAEESDLSLSDILNRVEHRYAASSFSADFFQASTIKAMEITDTASGKAFFKHPGMMRWEYEKPDKQIIITDSNTIWIYRPDDNQVMIGKSPSFFGDGKGASFLADMKLIRQKFSITLEKTDRTGYHVLKLVPEEKGFDLAVVYLAISTTTFNVDEITIYNSYEDETRIELRNIQFRQKLTDAMFNFQIPQGVEVMQLEE
jgi:outer membrane lipoprotein carrier protein